MMTQIGRNVSQDCYICDFYFLTYFLLKFIN